MNERTTLNAGELRVEFVRDADRYRHEVLAYSGESLRRLLSSIEGIADEPWPPSPPLQELHVEQRGNDVQVALLVGRAGRSHWSLSVEADPGRHSLVFDVACRAIVADDCLRSSYRLESMGLPPKLPTGAAITLASDYGLQILDGDAQAVADDGRLLRIIPRQGNSVPGKVATFRWQYQIFASQLPVGPSTIDAL